MTETMWRRGVRQRMSRRQAIRAGSLLGAGIAGAALIGCEDDDEGNARPPSGGTTPAGAATRPGPTTPGSPAGEPRQGGLFRWHMTTNSPNFNPVTNWTEGQFLSGQHVYDRLIEPKLDERLYVLGAAAQVETPEETTVIFTLREGLEYQNREPVGGRPVVAEDVVAMQLYARDADDAFNNAFQRASMESVEAPDDRTVIFRLRSPNAYLFSGNQLGQPHNQCIVPRELLDDLESIEPVGSGPYQLKDYQLDVRYRYERNPTYQRASEGLPYIDEREVIVLTDSSAHESAFRSEQIHVYQPTADASERLKRDLGDRVVVNEWLTLGPYLWNASARREPWEDVRAREALYRLFDPQPFIDLMDGGRAVPVPGALAPGLQRYLIDESETVQYKRHDPQEARQLLEAAGFDFEKEHELITLAGGSSGRNDVAIQIWQSQLEAAGVRIRAMGLPFSEWLGPRFGTGNYDFNINGHPPYDTPQTEMRYHHTDTRHIVASANLADPEVDAMIEATEVTLDPEENVDLVEQLQIELLKRYAPIAHVDADLVEHFQWDYMKDYELSPAAYTMYRVEAWMDI